MTDSIYSFVSPRNKAVEDTMNSIDNTNGCKKYESDKNAAFVRNRTYKKIGTKKEVIKTKAKFALSESPEENQRNVDSPEGLKRLSTLTKPINLNPGPNPVIKTKLKNTKISLIKTKETLKKDTSNLRLKLELLLNTKKQDKVNLVKMKTLDISKAFKFQSVGPSKPVNENNNIQFIRRMKHSTSQIDTIKITDMSKPKEKLETINEEFKENLVK